MKNLKMDAVKEYAEQKTLDYLRRHYSTETDHNAPNDEFIQIHLDEYNTCMDLFIAGYRFAENLNDYETEFEYSH